MNKNKKLKKLKSLVHDHDVFCGNFQNFELIEHLDKRIGIFTGYNSEYSISKLNAYTEIKNIVLELNIDKFQYFKISLTELKKINDSRESLKINTLKETRDNKGVYVGGRGGSNCNKIRYPKKNRSAKVWKMFYEMFPHKAIADGYNGKISNRMK